MIMFKFFVPLYLCVPLIYFCFFTLMLKNSSLFTLFCTFTSLRAVKLGCIREKTKINFVFPLIWINFSRSRKQIYLFSFL